MCTTAGGVDPNAGFGSVMEALRAGRAVAAYLNSPAARELDGAGCGEALVAVGAIQSALTAAGNGLLRRFDAADAHDADGYATAAAWLAAKTRLGRKDAKAAVRQMRLLGRHPPLTTRPPPGAVTVSWARDLAAWTNRIDDDAGLQREADQILLDAAAAGADLDDLQVIARAADEAWRAAQPDPDEGRKGFADRFLQLDATMDGAGRLTGDLTPECAAAVTAVLEALGKKRGPEDDRSAAQRFHDAFQEGCEQGSGPWVEILCRLRTREQVSGQPGQGSAANGAWPTARYGTGGRTAGTLGLGLPAWSAARRQTGARAGTATLVVEARPAPRPGTAQAAPRGSRPARRP
jgi:hypothetical protein